ncbi:OmpA family protein [bacterium SCSIO 12741]|nr:OmpA family protein [bacterium SCSIO 12741]
MPRFLLFVFLLISFSSFGQSKKRLKAERYLQEGTLLESGFDAEGAAKKYEAACKADPTFTKAWYQLAQLYTRNGMHPDRQKMGYLKVVQEDSTSVSALRSFTALSTLYLNEGHFDTALTFYSSYMNHPRFPAREKEKAEEKKEQLKLAVELSSHPLNIEPEALNERINRPGAMQYFPILTGDGEKLMFTRRHKGSQNEDVFLAEFYGDWQEPSALPSSINSHESEGTACMSADGMVMVLSYCGSERENFGQCDLYVSHKEKNGQWSTLKNLGAAINTEAYEAQPSLSADGRTLYFVSDREGGTGGLDIYYSHQDESGTWSNAQNAGSWINTEKNEGSPFLHANGYSLFFTSQGWPGLGGYDLFLSEKEAGNWTEPRNLGFPINDQRNQTALFVTADGRTGYYSRETYATENPIPTASLIYRFQVPPELKLGHRSNYVRGKVFDSQTKKPIQAELKLVDLETKETVGFVHSEPGTGKYLMILTEGSDYAFYAETPGYLFKSVSFEYQERSQFDPIEMDIYLDPIIKGVTVQLNNIYFQTGKAALLSKSRVELDKLYKLMKRNPTLKIELGGHTDNTGSEQVNETLSKKRVEAVKKYLVDKGIPANRMVGVGYGEAKPIATNDTPEGRKQNRRVEFTVL